MFLAVLRMDRMFLASRIQIRESEVRIRILLTSSKNRKKNLNSYGTVLRLPYDFLCLKNYVNVPSKSNKTKEKI